ncbi:beta-galactosidase [Leifsonia sp. 21MFCrub1.1]|uniref:beta-galactosidase n=1 Tax=Leifsonia sp. 21MFCrub1.1 TaxID=1798223 RepID=UPI0008928CFA|nr:beta-galactosidase [Leifsonia sp. 21MFCrub1.1]SEA44826.1 beta-galactosidase [Leifsonia sp. 21MFCrub1.1]
MMSIPTRLERARIVIDGEPRMVLAGEIHYFRLARADWEDRIRAAVDAGLNAVASYIPWIWHELPDGTIDVTGESRPERDLGAFIDLCAEHGLWFIARPGPFQMAELKNEGLPHRLRREHPEIHPVGWDGAPASTRTVDYLAPAFLAEAERWYDAVLAPLAERQREHGGPVIAVQLDNEVGMLDWVSNTPTLTDQAVREFSAASGIALDPRGGAAGTDDELALHAALGRFTRTRFARYLQTLEAWARDRGITAPLLVNIHGTGGGRGLTYPIGVSQLAPAYRGRAGLTGGTDMYLGELTVENVADLYLGNAITASVHGADQPLTALEFDAGDGDYGEDLAALTSPEATVLKTLLDAAQGVRGINYYLFAGGINPLLDAPVGDGDDRIGFTGERHGFAAPIGPEGERSPSLDGVAQATAAVREHERLFAVGTQVTDDLVLGFVADHYLTEYAHPAARRRQQQVRDLERHRGFGARQTLVRALVLGGWSFGALDLQAAAGTDPAWSAGMPGDDRDGRDRELIVLATGAELGRGVQEFLARHVRTGGRLLLVGDLPAHDADGTPCTTLADALGVTSAGHTQERVDADSEYHPTVRAVGPLADHGVREVRVGGAQLFAGAGEELLRERGTGRPAAVRVTLDGGGVAVLLGADYPVHAGFWRDLLALAGARPRLELNGDRPGVVAVPVAADGEAAIVAINVAPYPVTVAPAFDGAPLPAEPVLLPPRGHRILPLPDARRTAPTPDRTETFA